MNIDKIREKANSKGMSLTQLEEAAGIGNGVIGKWKEVSMPNMRTLTKIATVLEVPLDFFTEEK